MPVTTLCRSVTPAHRFGTVAVIAALALACGGGDGTGPGGGGGPTLSKAAPDGDNQAGRTGAQLASALRVKVTNGGQPVAGTTITWTVVSGGGSVNPASGATDASGIASTTVTLGSTAGTMTIRASASGVSGSPIQFTALAAGSSTTVEVTNDVFDPVTAAVAAGGTVTFDWPASALQHNVLPDGGNSIPSEPTPQNGPATLDVIFPAAGTFNYHCSVHGAPGSGMHGVILVVP
jgi:plastocyanin